MNSMFETSTKKYDRMNRIIAVGTGDRLPDGPFTTSLRFFELWQNRRAF
jgi:hypothetical protein